MNAITMPSSRAYNLVDHTYDVVVVGAGGSGLRATFGMGASGLKTACITKVFPTRSHTVAAQGGVAASLGNIDADDWRWHMYDTVKGSDWLGDQDAIEYMCREAVPAARTGALRRAVQPHRRRAYLPASVRRPHDRLRQGARPAGVRRSRPHRPRHPAHAVSAKPEADAEFFIEYFALDLIMDQDGVCRGVTAWNLEDGTIHRFRAQIVVLATGGYGRTYLSCTSAHTCTGDGNGMVLRAGLPCQDMEFVQFHPTGIFPRRLPDHRRRARRRRLSDQQRRRALHGALRADRQGSRQPRRGVALDDDRDRRGPWLRAEQRPHHAPLGASGRRSAA